MRRRNPVMRRVIVAPNPQHTPLEVAGKHLLQVQRDPAGMVAWLEQYHGFPPNVLSIYDLKFANYLDPVTWTVRPNDSK